MNPRLKEALLWGVVGLFTFLVLLQAYEIVEGVRVDLGVKASATVIVAVASAVITYFASGHVDEGDQAEQAGTNDNDAAAQAGANQGNAVGEAETNRGEGTSVAETPPAESPDRQSGDQYSRGKESSDERGDNETS